MDRDDASARARVTSTAFARIVVKIFGEPAARELLQALERPDVERAALIGRLQDGDEKQRGVAAVLVSVDDEETDLTCPWLIKGLRRELGGSQEP